MTPTRLESARDRTCWPGAKGTRSSGIASRALGDPKALSPQLPRSREGVTLWARHRREAQGFEDGATDWWACRFAGIEPELCNQGVRNKVSAGLRILPAGPRLDSWHQAFPI